MRGDKRSWMGRDGLRILAGAAVVLGFLLLQLWWWDVQLPWSASRRQASSTGQHPVVNRPAPPAPPAPQAPMGPVSEMPKRRSVQEPLSVTLSLAAVQFPRPRISPQVARTRFIGTSGLRSQAVSRPLTFPPMILSVARLPWPPNGQSPTELREADRRQEHVDTAALAALPPKLSLEGGPQYVTALAKDQQGHLWVGSEENGVFCYDPQTRQWQQFTIENGLGDDNAYALAVDRRNRVWVGHLKCGVSVHNGQRWQTYEPVGGLSRPGTLAGPLGERVFAIAICPTDGDVWIASNAGLCRYSEQKDTWSYYTRAEGLPADQIAAMAFDPQGNLYVGTQCDGLAMADAKDDYKAWRTVRGPDHLPTDPAGEGLPSSLINDVVVAGDGMIYAATVGGLARSDDWGKSWRYDRGLDWAAKVRGQYGGAPRGWSDRRGAWLVEDNVTCLAEDEHGLWLGHRKEGWELVDARAGRALSLGLGGKMVTRLLPTAVGPVVGTYGDGLIMPSSLALVLPKAEQLTAAPLPSGAMPPSEQELAGMLEHLKSTAASAAAAEGTVVLLDEDWRTRGNWLGRYGRSWACSCAILSGLVSPANYLWGTAPPRQIEYYANIGPNHSPGDSIRNWVHWLYTSNPTCLELPPVYLHSRVLRGYTNWQENRRQAEWDDHGEAYPRTHEGPDLYCNLSIPKGAFYISLYNANKDGHDGDNRTRDYSVSIRSWREGGDLRSFDGFEQQPELARTRICNFRGGCYKRFLVQGPAKLTIRINKNYSLNAILAGVFIDPVEPFPAAYFAGRIPTPALAATAADQLADEIGRLARTSPQAATMTGAADVRLLRWYAARPVPADLPMALRQLGCLYRQRYFEQWETLQQKLGLTSARQIEKSLRWDQRMPDCSGKESLILAKRQAAVE